MTRNTVSENPGFSKQKLQAFLKMDLFADHRAVQVNYNSLPVFNF